LVELPGIGEATAQKIISGRPYKSVDELYRAGVPKPTIEKIRGLVDVKPVHKPGESPAKRAPRLDLNTASADELKQLPGVGDANSKKIIAGRPYRSVDDLSKTGIPKSTIDKFRDEVTVGTFRKLNLNTASADELKQLPGIGDAMARKIVSGRPYKSVDELVKAGVPKTTVEKLRDSVTTRGSVIEARESGPDPSVVARTPPHPGMVWVNTDSGIFHKESSRWYGKTKEGKFMSQADALKAGYRESKSD
jgi:competence protein ComEA